MTDTLSTILVATGTSGITGFFTWLFTRRKYNEEVDGSKIDNLQRSLDFYIKLSDDTNTRLVEILDKNKDLEAQVQELKVENSVFKELVEKQNQQIEILTSEVTKLTKSVNKINK